jgi:proteic killer suppression protein
LAVIAVRGCTVRALYHIDIAWYKYRKLQMIDDATTDRDLRVPPSNHFEKLRGNLAGFHSIRVNNQWRLVFRWISGRGEAEGVYLDDHSYR